MTTKNLLLSGLFLALASCSSTEVISGDSKSEKKAKQAETGLNQAQKARDFLKKQNAAPFVPRKQMSADQVSRNLGQPNYKYSVGENQVWVYENNSRVKKEVKSAALNMVPFAGPVTSMVGGLMPSKPKTPKSVVTFDKNEKVIDVK